MKKIATSATRNLKAAPADAICYRLTANANRIKM
jgi:hypothetical protein